MMVQAPDMAPFPTLAPASGIAAGVADWQAVRSLPAFTVGGVLIVIVLVSLAAGQVPGGAGRQQRPAGLVPAGSLKESRSARTQT